MILNPAVAESLSARSGIVIQVSDVDSNVCQFDEGAFRFLSNNVVYFFLID